MSPSDSITQYIRRLKDGDPQAAARLFDCYFEQMARLARRRLGGTPRRAADEEDVALSAFDSFCRGAERGLFERLRDRGDLWRLLVVITARKAFDLVEHNHAARRGGGLVEGESALRLAGEGSAEGRIEQVPGREPAPEFVAQLNEELRRLLECLGETGLRQIALWKMEGYANEEIARRLGCGLRTVERKVKRIRGLWMREGGL
jgi:DNA-directed RNA polymerase specialized sigma24 family protein